MKLASSLRSPTAKLIMVGLVGLLGAAMFFLLRPGLTSPPAATGKISLALPLQISAGALFVAAEHQFFANHKLAVTIATHALGKDALQAVLSGEADLAVLADTPFMFAVMRGEKIATVASIFGSRKTMAIVGRKDRRILRAEDLGGKTIGTIFGTNAQFFLDVLLLAHGVPRESVKVVDLAPEALEAALRSGRVDAITVFNPKMKAAIGDRGTTIYGEDLFVYRFVLVGKQSYLDSHQAEIGQLLASIEQSNRFIHEEPALAKTIIGQAISTAPDLMAGYFEPNDFQISLDQSLLLALGDQTRWAMKQQLVPVGTVPNYLDYVRQAPLDAIRPSANKIIR